MLLLGACQRRAKVSRPHWSYDAAATNGHFPVSFDDGYAPVVPVEHKLPANQPHAETIEDMRRCYNE